MYLQVVQTSCAAVFPEETAISQWFHSPLPHASKDLTRIIHEAVEIYRHSALRMWPVGFQITQLWGKIAENQEFFVIRLRDQETGKEIEVATNNAALSAAEVSDIYRKRWAIELFFKWLKQNLKMRRMLGFSENAVQLQIWISLIFYLLLWRMYAIAKEKASGFLEFLRHFRSRLLLPES